MTPLPKSKGHDALEQCFNKYMYIFMPGDEPVAKTTPPKAICPKKRALTMVNEILGFGVLILHACEASNFSFWSWRSSSF